MEANQPELSTRCGRSLSSSVIPAGRREAAGEPGPSLTAGQAAKRCSFNVARLGPGSPLRSGRDDGEEGRRRVAGLESTRALNPKETIARCRAA